MNKAGEKRNNWKINGILSCTALILLMFMAEPWRGRQQIAVLDVGQGDGIVVQSQGAQILIDGGSSSRSKVGTYVILPYLKSQGISRLTGIFLTHTDEDHVNGIQEILKEAEKGWLAVDHLFIPEWMRDTEVGKSLIRTAESSGISCRTLQAGDLVQMKKMRIEILHPAGEDFSHDTNGGSLVFVMEMDGIRGIFTGDLPTEEEKRYWSGYRIVIS